MDTPIPGHQNNSEEGEPGNIAGCPKSTHSRQCCITYTRVVDLSHVIHPGIPRWPGDPPVAFESVAELEKNGWYLRRFSMGEHSGTHLNAPNSFQAEGGSIDSYSAASLVVPAIVIDVRDRTSANLDYALPIAEVLAWEWRHGFVSAGSVVLLYTGWQAKWHDPAAFLGQDRDGGLHFPGFGADTARFLLDERSIAGIGIDTYGVDPGQDSTFAINRLLGGYGRSQRQQPRIVLENLANLDQLPPTGATLVIGILRLKGGAGSPVSVLAFVP